VESIVNFSLCKALWDKCHKFTYTRVKQEVLLKWRSGLRQLDTLETKCMNYYKHCSGSAFEKKFSKCCDVFKTH